MALSSTEREAYLQLCPVHIERRFSFLNLGMLIRVVWKTIEKIKPANLPLGRGSKNSFRSSLMERNLDFPLHLHWPTPNQLEFQLRIFPRFGIKSQQSIDSISEKSYQEVFSHTFSVNKFRGARLE